MFRFLALCCLCLSSGLACAEINISEQDEPEKKDKGVFLAAMPTLIYSYIDFDFESNAGSNVNQFSGHSNIGGGGISSLKLIKDITAGVYFYHIDTSNTSFTRLSPNAPSLYRTTNKNNTILVHLLKPLKKGFYADAGAAYGFNQVTVNGTIYPDGIPDFSGFARYHFNNWFANATLLYQHRIKSFFLSAYLQGLYTESNIGNYTQQFTSTLTPLSVAPLSTKITYAIENATLRYHFDNGLYPYLSAGLVQVVDYKQNRSTISSTVNGSLPQFALDQDGYRLGAGIGFNKKKLTSRLEYRFYRATHQFHSSQVIVNFSYLLD